MLLIDKKDSYADSRRSIETLLNWSGGSSEGLW